MVDVNYKRLEFDKSRYPDAAICLDCWEGLRGDRLAPRWDEFDWLRVPPEIIPHMGVVDVHLDPLDFIYRFWGSAHVEVLKQELTGRSVTEMRPESEARSVFQQYAETYEACRPMLFENIISAGPHLLPMEEVSLRLPFSLDGERITQILAFSDIRRDFKRLKESFLGRPRR